jgi:diacylglycerol O-acyltransferase / wax synthase
MADVLTALDATFLELEQQNDGALMSIGGVMVFDPPPGDGAPSIRTLNEQLAKRLSRFPRYSERLSSPRTGHLSWPQWIPDERFDVRNHVSHVVLPSPGGPEELCDFTADFYSHRLDRSRPLWEMALIEGLEQGRWALALKMHHCLVDGVGSVGVLGALLDTEPSPREPRSTASSPAHETAPLSRPAVVPSQPVAQAARAGVRTVEAGAHALLHPRDALARSRSLAELLIRDELIGAPQSSLNVPIGSTRRFAVVKVPLSEMKAIRSTLGGSVNDVVLAACATGLRRLLLARGEEPPGQGLRAMVPMNVRDSSEQAALGNRVSSLFVELPVAEPLAQARYRKIVAATARLKASDTARGTSTALDLAGLAPPVLHALLVRTRYLDRLFNVTITNVPGSRVPLYAFGAQLREVHPIVPLAADHSVGIAVFSYTGLVTFGVIADSESTPDIAELAYGIEEGIEELQALVPDAVGSV